MTTTRMTVVRILAFLMLFPALVMAQSGGPVPLPSDVPLAQNAPSVTRRVDCNAGQTIQAAVDLSRPGDLILVSGHCDENVVIAEHVQDVTLNGQGTATINGVAPGSSTLLIRGRGVSIKGFTITGVAGGLSGISVYRGGSAVIDGNIIENVSNHGIHVVSHSSARIVNNTIQGNGQDGIVVNENSSARIGIFAINDAVANPNIIRLNGRRGIAVTRSSNARIAGNEISQNGLDGINVVRGAQADIASNDISANEGHGILINQSSVVILGSNSGSGLLDAPNTSTTNNANRGLYCINGGLADGRLGGLNGNIGQFFFQSNCINSLIP